LLSKQPFDHGKGQLRADDEIANDGHGDELTGKLVDANCSVSFVM